MFRRMIVVAFAPLWAACSAVAPEDPDLTPMNPTAVRETRIVSTGVQEFATFTSTNVTYTRPKMQRREYSINPKSASPASDNEPQVRIDLLERKIAWRLDQKAKKAIECPLQGCIAPAARKGSPGKLSEQDKTRDPNCRLKIGNPMLKVVSTGAKRNINGFDTEQYTISWLVTLRDNASRKSTGTVSVDLWTAPVTLGMDEAIGLERTYARAHDKILAAGSEARPGLLPYEVDTLLNAYLAQSATSADRANLLAAMSKVDEAKGYPILMRVKWTVAGAACSTDATPTGAGDKPLFVLTWEVKSQKLLPLHDSLFAPPKGYKIRKG